MEFTIQDIFFFFTLTYTHLFGFYAVWLKNLHQFLKNFTVLWILFAVFNRMNKNVKLNLEFIKHFSEKSYK